MSVVCEREEGKTFLGKSFSFIYLENGRQIHDDHHTHLHI